MAADLILVVGCTGAGKTTYARALADEIGAVRFSIDEWMMALFWADSPQPIQFAWTMERVNRCETQIFAMAQQLAECGVPAILDLGFTKREHREKFRVLAREAGLTAAVHFIDVPANERWFRVNRRNKERAQPMPCRSTARCSTSWKACGNRPTKTNGAPMAGGGSLGNPALQLSREYARSI